MLRAHIQAWVWQDEWVGLTMDDIRRIEQETQELLKKTMAQDGQNALTDSPSQETNLAAAASGGAQSSGAATPSVCFSNKLSLLSTNLSTSYKSLYLK